MSIANTKSQPIMHYINYLFGPLRSDASVEIKRKRIFFKNLSLPLIVGVIFAISCQFTENESIRDVMGGIMALIAIFISFQGFLYYHFPPGTGSCSIRKSYSKKPSYADICGMREEYPTHKYSRFYRYKQDDTWIAELECY